MSQEVRKLSVFIYMYLKIIGLINFVLRLGKKENSIISASPVEFRI